MLPLVHIQFLPFLVPSLDWEVHVHVIVIGCLLYYMHKVVDVLVFLYII